MSKIVVGEPVPDFEMHVTGDRVIRLSDLKGQHVVLYFYPKDNTPGCTTEGQDFRDHYRKFTAAHARVFGVSRDSLKSHTGFKQKHDLPFELVSDPNEKLCRLFDVIKEKNMYGNKVMGIERSTFVIDKQGALRAEFRKVKVDGHVAEVLATVKRL